jgi:hypothetical protein
VGQEERIRTVTDYHVITPESAELVMQVVDGQLVIVPPPAETPAKEPQEFTEIQL